MSEPYPPPPSPSGDTPPPPVRPMPEIPAPPQYPSYSDRTAMPAQQMGAVPQQTGPTGQVRSTGICILLAIVTLGIYTWYWYYKVHTEMKAHSGQGIGGPVALILAIFIGVANPYITSSEVGGLYVRRGQPAPVSAITGLWYFPGMLILVGPIVWFVKTNGALNTYWESLLGASG